jgi:8-oxo-dGTP pyrophosphatase MutT (NUDIX family)
MHTTELWKPNAVVATIVERDGRYLFVEEEADGRAVFNQPAGHLDPGETLLDAARRETLEESGWHVEPTSLVGIYLVEPPNSPITYLRFCFRARAISHDAARKLDKEIIRPVWMNRAELVAESARHRSPLVLRCLDDYLAGHDFPLSMIHDLRFGG